MSRRKNPEDLQVMIGVRLPPKQKQVLENWVNSGIYPSVGEAVRSAVREFIMNHPAQGGAAACPAQ